jgi:hypothetical protein
MAIPTWSAPGLPHPPSPVHRACQHDCVPRHQRPAAPAQTASHPSVPDSPQTRPFRAPAWQHPLSDPQPKPQFRFMSDLQLHTTPTAAMPHESCDMTDRPDPQNRLPCKAGARPNPLPSLIAPLLGKRPQNDLAVQPGVSFTSHSSPHRQSSIHQNHLTRQFNLLRQVITTAAQNTGACPRALLPTHSSSPSRSIPVIQANASDARPPPKPSPALLRNHTSRCPTSDAIMASSKPRDSAHRRPPQGISSDTIPIP